MVLSPNPFLSRSLLPPVCGVMTAMLLFRKPPGTFDCLDFFPPFFLSQPQIKQLHALSLYLFCTLVATVMRHMRGQGLCRSVVGRQKHEEKVRRALFKHKCFVVCRGKKKPLVKSRAIFPLIIARYIRGSYSLENQDVLCHSFLHYHLFTAQVLVRASLLSA